jgi:multicomponent Na+:H+ antiporter subunit B
MLHSPAEGMTVIVKTITRLTVGLILLYGIYVVLHGHLTPGGGFAGGVVVALSLAHVTLAFGKRTALRLAPDSGVKAVECLGALLFLGLALLGLAAGAAFFANVLPKGSPFALWSAGFIPLCNIAIAAKVGAGLFAAFLALALLKPEVEDRS